MNNFITVLLSVILISALLLGIAYAIDHNRMASGDEVVFSTWGKDYTPEANDISVPSDGNTNDEKSAESEVLLYFADDNITGLKTEKRKLLNDDNIAKATFEALVSGPETEGLNALISSDAEIIAVSVNDGLCTIDLNDEFSNFTLGSSMENLVLYSLVNSLCSIDGVDRVKINIEGDESAVFGSHFSLEEVFEADMSLVK